MGLDVVSASVFRCAWVEGWTARIDPIVRFSAGGCRRYKMTRNRKWRRRKARGEMMSRVTRKREGPGRWQLAVFFSSISLQAILGLADDPSNSKEGAQTVSHSNSGSSKGLNALYISIGVVAVILLAVFLFKQWQKKKREEQHARLLRLFEEDDELELELGLRD